MAITLGGSGSGAGSDGASTCATGVFGTQPTAGSTIAVAVSWLDDGGDFTSVTDNASGNTYAQITDAFQGSTGQHTSIWYAKNIATAASFVVTANFTGNCLALRISAVELKSTHTTESNAGISSANVQASPGTGTDAVTSGAAGTAPVDDCAVFGACCPNGGIDTLAAGTGFTALHFVNPGSNQLRTEYQIQTTAAACEATFTMSPNIATLSAVAVFLPAAVGGSTWGPQLSHVHNRLVQG